MRYFSFLLIVICFLSCSKNSQNNTKSNGYNIYASGMEPLGQRFVAVYWKNGIKTQLPSNPSGEAYTFDIFVKGSDIYVVGFEEISGTHYPVLWKNSTKIQLSTSPGEATSVFVSGDDVYICGTEYLSTTNTGQTVAFLWKNGIKTRYGINSSASCIFVSGYDVFVAGQNARNVVTAATYWQNGVEAKFLPFIRSTAFSIFVSGPEVYMLGKDFVTGLPALWRRTIGGASNLHTQTTISTVPNSNVTSISVTGSDTYISGNENGACYWKNGVRTQLSGSGSSADKVFTIGKDFYIAGRGGDNLTAGYWKNGTRVELSSIRGSYATSIFVN